jgi:RHS repeat-associated protein
LWALADNQGTVRDVVDSTGTVVNHVTYDSFGGITSQSNPTASMRFGYTGREFDEETGQYYYRARYYDAAVGEFISEDPIGFNGGDANLYRYVGNSPINRIDPSGLLTLYQGNPLIDGLSAGNPGIRQVLNLVPAIKSFNFKIQVDAGESFAQSAQQWYVQRYVDANTPSWQKPLYFTGGLFASLWTPCNSDATTAVLTTAWGTAKPAANTTLNDVRGFLRRLKGAGNLDDAARGTNNFFSDVSDDVAANIRGTGLNAINEGTPTWKEYANLRPNDLIDYNVQARQIKFDGNKWIYTNSLGQKRTPNGLYNFVAKDRKIHITRQQYNGAGGHIDNSKGLNVDFAGQVRFGHNKSNRGQIKYWNNASGHYRPTSLYSNQAGFPQNLYRSHRN